MNELFIYLIKAAIINAIILAFYHFTLRNSNKFQLMRATLMLAMVLPLIFPLIPYPFDLQQYSNNLPVISITLPETSIVTAETNPIFNWTEMPSLFYYGVSLVLLTGMVISISSIIQKRLRSKEHITSFGRVELEYSVKSPFSFFSWVFLSPIDLKHPQLDMILKHEFCHVREKHSIDRVLSGIFRSVLWFSPFSHITSRLLSEVHEYQADSKVIGVYDRRDYSDLILSFYMNPHSSAISNNFSLHIKKRITMINNLNFNRLRYGRILIGLGFSLSLLLLTSMVTTTSSQGNELSSNKPLIGNGNDTTPPYPTVDLNWLKVKDKAELTGHSGKVIIGMIIEPDGTAKDIKIVQSAGEYLDQWSLDKISKVQRWNPAMYKGKPVQYKFYYPFTFIDDNKVELKGSIGLDRPDTIKNPQHIRNDQNEMPDSPPQFPGGDKARIEYIIANTPYPEEDRKAGIKGTVYVQFVIESSGKVTNAKILKGVSPLIDKVALNAITNMPDWIPARKGNKPVSYEMTMPIKFSLEDKVKEDVIKDTKSDNKTEVPVEQKKEENYGVYTVVEVSPKFPGGDEARAEYMSKNISYPEDAVKKGIEGTVYITFVVQADGTVTDAKVLRGIGGGLDEIALNAVKNMPKWEPGRQKGKPVAVQFNIPIKFKLPKEEKKVE